LHMIKKVKQKNEAKT